MRLRIFVLAAGYAASLAGAQTADPSYEPLSKAYEALRARDYDEAIAFFLKAIEAARAPGHAQGSCLRVS